MLQIYLKYGSEAAPLTQGDIVRYLKEDYGVAIERKAVGRNIMILKEMGFDIRSATQGTYLGGKDPYASVFDVLAGKDMILVKSGEKAIGARKLQPATYKPMPLEFELVVDRKLLEKMERWFGSSVVFAEHPSDPAKIRAIGSNVAIAVSFAMRYFQKAYLTHPASAKWEITGLAKHFAEKYGESGKQ